MTAFGHHQPPGPSAPPLARLPVAGFGAKKARKVLIKATKSSAAQSALLRDGAHRAASKARAIGAADVASGGTGGGGRGAGGGRIARGNPYPFSMSLPSSSMAAPTAFKNKRYYKQKYS
jgi:hypothetical protein